MTEHYKTRAIVLHSMQHGESGHIVFMYTEAWGRVSYYLTSGKRGVPVIGNSKIMLHPLTAIELVGYKSSGTFHKIKEAKRSFIATNMLSDVYKSTMAVYVAELLYKVVKESEQNAFLFDFIYYSVGMLDSIDRGKSNFHLYFTLELTKYLGIYPTDNYEDEFYFDIIRGEFVVIRPKHELHMERESSALLHSLMQLTPKSLDTLRTSGDRRCELLYGLIEYISYHHDTKYRIKSLEYMADIF